MHAFLILKCVFETLITLPSYTDTDDAVNDSSFSSTARISHGLGHRSARLSRAASKVQKRGEEREEEGREGDLEREGESE